MWNMVIAVATCLGALASGAGEESHRTEAREDNRAVQAQVEVTPAVPAAMVREPEGRYDLDEFPSEEDHFPGEDGQTSED